MRESGVPQFTVDSHRALGDFDLLGVSFSTELGYTNLLTALDLAGMPLHAADRSEDDPLVIAGGHAAFNPEPIADFIDAAVIGDGEQAVLTITDIVTDWKASGQSGWAARAAAPAGPHRRRLRAGVLRRVVPRRRPDPAGRPAGRAARRAVARLQAHRHGPRRLAVPEAAARAARRVGARADVGRDLPGLHPGLPVLPGGHDHATGARAVDHRHRRDGRTWSGGNGIRGGRPPVAVVGRPLRDRRHHQGAGRPLRGHADRAVAPVDPRRRVQHRPRQRAHPERAAVGSDLRARGRLRADPQGHQQDGDRGGPHRDGLAPPTAPAGGR